MSDVNAPKTELRNLIQAKLADHTTPDGAQAAADAIIELFHDVCDDWEQIDTSTWDRQPRSWLDQRWLVARVPRESVERVRQPNREVVERG